MIIKLVIGVFTIVSVLLSSYTLSHHCLIGFHGPSGQYSGVYGKERMRQVAEMASKHLLKDSMEVFFYFNNTDSHSPPAAIQDCRYLAEAFRELKILSEEN